MCKKLIYLVSCIFVLSIAVGAQAAPPIYVSADPSVEAVIGDDGNINPNKSFTTYNLQVSDLLSNLAQGRRVTLISYDISGLKAKDFQMFKNMTLSFLGGNSSGQVDVYGVTEDQDNISSGLTWKSAPGVTNDQPIGYPVALDEADLTGKLLSFTSPKRDETKSIGSAALDDFLNSDTDGTVTLLLAPAKKGTNALMKSSMYSNGGVILEGEIYPLPIVAHWPMDEGAGTVVADVMGDNDGEIIGNVSWIDDGALGGAVALDVNDPNAAIFVPNSAELDFGDVDFTISMWVRYPAVPGTGQHELMTKGTTGAPGTGKRYTIFHKGDRMRFEIDNDISKSSLSLSDANFISGEWVHLVAIRDSVNDELLMYADGVLLGTAQDTSDDISSGEDMYIGNSPPIYGNNVSPADIDDVRIFSAALTPYQISEIYLVAHWPMDEGAGTVVADVIGGNDGEIVGNVSWIDGALGGAVTFDVGDPNATIAIPHSAELDFGDDDFSISLLIRYPIVPGTDEHQLIMKGSFGSPDSGSRYTLFHKGTAMRFEIDNGPANVKSSLSLSDAAFITGEWVNIVVIRDSVNDLLLMYADGVLQGTATDSSGDISSGEDMRIGNTTIGNGRTCEADIDDVRIYAKALSEEEVGIIDQRPTAAMIVNDVNLPAGFDMAQKVRLGMLGYKVSVATGADVSDGVFTAADAETFDVLVVSETIGSSQANNLIGANVPMMHQESYGWSRHFFTLGLSKTWLNDPNGEVNIVNDAHPIIANAGLSAGPVTFYTDPTVAWTTDSVDSLVVGAENLAQIANADGVPYTIIFTIEAGTELADASLAANRVCGFSLPGTGPFAADVMTDEAWAMFDAAIAWLDQ